MKKAIIGALALGIFMCAPITAEATYAEVGQYGRPGAFIPEDTTEQISEEQKLGDMELIAQLVQAEAGNQDFEGKCLVVDVVLNRVDSPKFPNTVEEVIFQDKQFSVVKNGAWEKAAWHMTEDDYDAVQAEYESRGNKDVLYFCATGYISKTKPLFKHGGHYFSY
jgi:spore germination cell wall hydrolase CwlJ-like protein